MPETVALAFDPNNPVTIRGVKKRLVGLDPWFDAARQRGYDDEDWLETIADAISLFEAEAGFRIRPTQIVMADDSALVYNGTFGVLPESLAPIPVEQHTRLSYYPDQQVQWQRMELPVNPIRAVQRVRIFLGDQPNYEFPSSWIQFDAQSGTLNVLPWTGSAQGALSGYALTTMMRAGSPSWGVPYAYGVDYVAGLSDNWHKMPRWAYLRRGLEEIAALKVLEDISHVYDPGMPGSSSSTFGVSTQVQYTRFQDRKTELEKTRQEIIAKLKPGNSVDFEVL